jgi:hypothetical protein
MVWFGLLVKEVRTCEKVSPRFLTSSRAIKARQAKIFKTEPITYRATSVSGCRISEG